MQAIVKYRQVPPVESTPEDRIRINRKALSRGYVISPKACGKIVEEWLDTIQEERWAKKKVEEWSRDGLFEIVLDQMWKHFRTVEAYAYKAGEPVPVPYHRYTYIGSEDWDRVKNILPYQRQAFWAPFLEYLDYGDSRNKNFVISKFLQSAIYPDGEQLIWLLQWIASGKIEAIPGTGPAATGVVEAINNQWYRNRLRSCMAHLEPVLWEKIDTLKPFYRKYKWFFLSLRGKGINKFLNALGRNSTTSPKTPPRSYSNRLEYLEKRLEDNINLKMPIYKNRYGKEWKELDRMVTFDLDWMEEIKRLRAKE